MIESAYDFHLRAKHDLYKSLIDGTDLENASANYEFSKMNAIRHGVFQPMHYETTLSLLTHDILKSRRKTNRGDFVQPFQRNIGHQSGLSDASWIPRLKQYVDGHNKPRDSHSTWPSMNDVDSKVAFGSISPWDTSPLMHNSQWGKPQWIETLASSWQPYDKDGELTNYHKAWLEPEVRNHEKLHSTGFHNENTYLGRIEGDGNIAAPSDLYRKHFWEWLNQAPQEIKEASPIEQRQAHLDQYKRVWAGKEKDPLDIYDTGNHALGMLGYGLGLEWLKPSDRDAVIQHISEHGLNSEKRMPFVNQGWVSRNFKGRLGPEIMHRIRGHNATGSAIPPQYYDMVESGKTAYDGRRLIESMKQILVYDKDDKMQDVKAGDIPVGFFDERGWNHDLQSEDAFVPLDRPSGAKHEQHNHFSTNRQRQLGMTTLHNYIQQQHGMIPRRIKDENGEYEQELSTHHDIHEDEALSGMDEFDDLLHQGFIDENQHYITKDHLHSVGEQFERQREILNGMGPYLNMYHLMGGDSNNLRMSPYGLFMMPHQSRGGVADDPQSPITELDHMFHPDIWGGENDGLFTEPTSPTSPQYILPLKEGDSIQEAYPEQIWPKKTGMLGAEGDFSVESQSREESQQLSLNIDGHPRDSMQGILGFMSDHPRRGSGVPFNMMSGKLQAWPQFSMSHDPQYHHEFSRQYNGGPLYIGDWETDEYGKGHDEQGMKRNDPHYSMARTTLNHIMNDRGRKDDKRQRMLGALWGRWSEHPADGGVSDSMIGQLVGGNVSPRMGKWERELSQLAREESLHLIPGQANDIDERVRQFLFHADLGRESVKQDPLPLLDDASNTFNLDNVPQHVSSMGMVPGETSRSTKEEGWLGSKPGSWFMYKPVGEPTDESQVRDFTSRGHHIEKVTDKKGERAHRFEFPTRQAGLQAMADGTASCPVCNGDGRIDPEDVAKADLPNLFGEQPPTSQSTLPNLFDSETSATPVVGEECPNCNGTGKHTFSQEGLQSMIMPSKQDHKESVMESSLDSFLASPEDERDEEWYKNKEAQSELPRVEQLGRNPYGDAQNNYYANKWESTNTLVSNAAKLLASKIQKQFEDSELPDPFGPDENGDWSQAHVNALALWSHANDWILRAQPEHRDWDDDIVHGVWTEDDGTPKTVDDMTASSAIYWPQNKNISTDKRQHGPGSLPLSIFNSTGLQLKHGWKMSPTYGVHFSVDGHPEVLHNGGLPAADKQPFLNVPINHLQQVFPEMQPMTREHPSAPAGGDEPEAHKEDEYGNNVIFQLSEDNIPVSTLLKALTNPDIIKEDAAIKPIKAAHRIFSFDDMKHLRGFSGDWLLSSWYDGHRAIVKKQGKKVEAEYADGSTCKLSRNMRIGLIDANDDRYVADVIINKKHVYFIDLLEHGHKELYEEPLKDRIVKLRTQFESTEDVLIPAPFNTRRTDEDGLEEAVHNLQAEENDGILIRDAISTYMRGESRHPKWVLLREEKEMDVMIIDKRGTGPYMYRLGIGPINDNNAESLGNRAAKHGGKWYMDVGTISRERKPYLEGDFVRVSISSVTSKEREGEEVYDIQPVKILGESTTLATDSVETLNVLTKSYTPIIYPHDILVKSDKVEIHIDHMEDIVIYKAQRWDNSWVLYDPISAVNDLSDSDYAIQMSESLRPFWQPIAGLTLNNLIKVDFNPRDSNEKSRDEKEDEKEDKLLEDAFTVEKPKKKDSDQILKPEMTKMLVSALTIIDDILAKEKSTWTGARGLGIGLGTPDSAPRGPTELTNETNTLDYDMRHRDEDESDKPKEVKATGEIQPKQELVETDDGEEGEIRVTEEEAVLDISNRTPA